VGEEVQLHSFVTSAIDELHVRHGTQLKILNTSLVAVDHFMCDSL